MFNLSSSFLCNIGTQFYFHFAPQLKLIPVQGNIFLGEPSKKKKSPIVEKGHNFLGPPPPRMMWTFLNLGKKWFLMTPPPRQKLGKIWNVDYFDIVAPPLTLAKTVPKSYQTDIWGLFYSYIGHICTKCCIYLTNISPIYHKNQGPISVIWIWEKTEKSRPPPLSQSQSTFEM